jgi:bifunctional non-homologous end joining protein LigD
LDVGLLRKLRRRTAHFEASLHYKMRNESSAMAQQKIRSAIRSSAGDPMPQAIVPMMARLSKLPYNEEDFGYEIKWDGVRAIAFAEGGSLRLQSRNLLDNTRQYTELQPLAGALKSHTAILDGEIVALNEQGIPSFELLQNRMGQTALSATRLLSARYPVTYMIFDLLYLDDRSLMHLPYVERRKQLDLLKLDGPAWHTPPYHAGDGKALLEASRAQKLEGIIAKKLSSIYEPGQRSGAWLKIKNVNRQECVIGGYLLGEGSRHGRIGALLLGYYDIIAREATKRGVAQKLVYAGKAGTGFTDAMLDKLAAALKPLVTTQRPFEVDPPKFRAAIYVEPKLVGEFEFTEWTNQHMMRHPSFKGLRADKNPRDVVREELV